MQVLAKAEPAVIKKIFDNEPSRCSGKAAVMSQTWAKQTVRNGGDDSVTLSLKEKFMLAAQNEVGNSAQGIAKAVKPSYHKLAQAMKAQLKGLSDFHYIGVPLRVRGAVVGTVCALCTEDWVDGERKARLEAEALRLGPMLEKWAMEAEFKLRREKGLGPPTIGRRSN